MLVVRGLCSFTSISLLYTSVQLMPLSDAVVLQFLSPLMVALAAPLLLKELPSRCAAVLCQITVHPVVMQMLHCPAMIVVIMSFLYDHDTYTSKCELTNCRLIWVCVPMCLVGVLLTAQPSVLFGSRGSMSISQAGIAVGITQVCNCHRPIMLLRLAT